jgi:hypothetical protein
VRERIEGKRGRAGEDRRKPTEGGVTLKRREKRLF